MFVQVRREPAALTQEFGTPHPFFGNALEFFSSFSGKADGNKIGHLGVLRDLDGNLQQLFDPALFHRSAARLVNS